jgi:16S rRNA (guanine527-N7)-methyltransferase
MKSDVTQLFDVRDAPLIDALSAKLGLATLDVGTRERLVTYLGLVSTWSARVDLTAARNAQALVEVMLADACMLADPELVATDELVLDVGTGVGAPVLALCLLRQDVRAVCIEPRRKRMAFLRTVVGQLDLVKRVTLHETRIEPDAPMSVGPELPTLACSRATFSPERWLPMGLALAPRAAVLAAREPLPLPGERAKRIAERRYRLPFSGAERTIGLYARM